MLGKKLTHQVYARWLNLYASFEGWRINHVLPTNRTAYVWFIYNYICCCHLDKVNPYDGYITIDSKTYYTAFLKQQNWSKLKIKSIYNVQNWPSYKRTNQPCLTLVWLFCTITTILFVKVWQYLNSKAFIVLLNSLQANILDSTGKGGAITQISIILSHCKQIKST